MFSNICERCQRVLWVLAVIIIAIFASLASAQTVVLRVDAVNGSPNNANPPPDGLDWDENAFQSLQDALDAADALLNDPEEPPASVQLWIAAGAYKPSLRTVAWDPRSVSFVLRSSVGLYGGFVGNEPGDESGFLLRNPAANEVIFDGDLTGDDDPGEPATFNENAWHVVTAKNVNATAIVDGVTIQNGNANGAPHVSSPESILPISDEGGGGLFVYPDPEAIGTPDLSPTLLRCIFLKNRGYDSGAVLIHGSQLQAQRFINCRFEENTGTLTSVFNSNGYRNISVFVNCLVAFNTAGSFENGPAIGAGGVATLRLFNCTVTRNSSGLTHDDPGLEGIVSTVVNSIIYDNGTGDFDDQINGFFCVANCCIEDLENHPNEPLCSFGNCTDCPGEDEVCNWVSCTGENPEFIDPDGDFRLGCESPCKNIGRTTLYDSPAWTDFGDLDQDQLLAEGTPDLQLAQRLVGTDGDPSAWLDLGAYELQQTTYESVADIVQFPCETAVVDVDDLLLLISSWGDCPDTPLCCADCVVPCPADIAGGPPNNEGPNSVVNVDDLLAVINGWSEQMPEHVFDCFDFCDRYTGAHWEACMNACVARACFYHPEECD